MIAQLGSLNPQRLGVIARTSSMAYKASAKRVDQIARELGVDYVLETSLRQSTNRLRVTAQLIRASDQTHTWAQDYDVALGDIVALQNDVADAVAGQIQVRLIPEEQARRASILAANPDAHYAYIKGRFFWNKRTLEAMDTALKYFEQAIAADPNYAPGYSGLSDCYQLLAAFGRLKPNEAYPLARAAALKALALDDRLAEAHTSLASIEGDFDWDWFRAEAEYRRAIELNPSYATAHHWFADFLAGLGRLDEATAEIKKALAADPLSPVIAVTLGEMYGRAGQFDRAIAQYRKVLEMYPMFPQAHSLLAETYAYRGMYAEAVAETTMGDPQWGGVEPVTWAYGLAMSGRKTEALRLIPEIKKKSDAQHIDYNLAVVYTALGDNDRAFEGLEGAFRGHDYLLTLVQADFRLANIRSDPRFQDLLRRMKMPPATL